jgi:hypothetical protein
VRQLRVRRQQQHSRGGAPLLLEQQELCVLWVLRSSAVDLK